MRENIRLHKAPTGVAHIIIARNRYRNRGNAFSTSMFRQMQKHLNDLRRDQDCRVLIITAKENDFCLGRDVMMRGKEEDIQRIAYRVLLTLQRLTIPSVVAVHGRAIGFGAALALACDFCFMDEASSFQFPEASFGFPPLASSLLLQKLPRRVALEMVFSPSKAWSGIECMKRGIADVVPLPENTAHALADQIAQVIPEVSKSILYLAARTPMEREPLLAAMDICLRQHFGKFGVPQNIKQKLFRLQYELLIRRADRLLREGE